MDKFDTIIKTIYDNTIKEKIPKRKTYYVPLFIVLSIFIFIFSVIVVNYFKKPLKDTGLPKKQKECQIFKNIKYIISDINDDDCPELLCNKQDELYCVQKPGGQRLDTCYSNPMEMLVKHIWQQSKFDDKCFRSNQILRLYNQITDDQVIKYNISLIKKLSDVPDEIKLGFDIGQTDQKKIDKLSQELIPKELIQEITLFYKFLNINNYRAVFPDNIKKDTNGYTQLDHFSLLLNTLTDYKKNLLNRAIGT